MIRLALLLLLILSGCAKTATPRDAVLTGTVDQNLVGIAGKPVATVADGVQKVAWVDQNGNTIQSSKDPCDGNTLLNFNQATDSTNVVTLVPPVSGQNAYLCSIHAHGNFDAKVVERIAVFEGGGSNCGTSPTYLIGAATPDVWISGGGNGGFIEGGAGATIYKTTAANRGICVKAAGSNPVRFSGTYIRQ